MSIMLAFTVAGYNLDRIAAFIAKTAHAATAEKRAKRRTGTWADMLAPVPVTPGPDPPPD
jgi:hypothetical protein